MSTKFFTNQDKNTLFNKLNGVFSNNPFINNFDILVGYFRSSGYFKLRPLLENIDNIRILVGIDVDKLTQESHSLGLVYQENKDKINQSWQEKFTSDIKQSNYDKETEAGIKQFVEDISKSKVILKVHPSQKIHAKIYIFRPDNFNEHTASSVITGSSNLTDSGLGTKDNANYEFNVLLNDYQDVKFATDEFEKLWTEGVDILPETVEQGLKKTHLLDDISPYDLYLKMLYEYFGEEIDTPTINDLPKGFKKLSYQEDAVHQGCLLLEKHNGFFLADVVGLGKTMIATLIAKKFWHKNNRNCRILVVTPPAIKPNWQETFTKFKLNANYKIITNGSLDKVQENQYDLVIIDESHKFRNDNTNAYDLLQKICKKVAINENNEISVQQSKVILISATPLNNKPDDIFNQVLLFQDKNNTTLGTPLGSFFSESAAKYKEIKYQENNAKEVKALYKKIRDKIIQPLTVRRTRTDLTTNERYKKDLQAQEIIFPKIEKPQQIYYQLEESLNALFDSTLKLINPSAEEEGSNQGLFYTRYQAVRFLTEEKKKNYQSADAMAIGLKGIMKTLLLKRMDSSFYAFNNTLNAFLCSSKAMLEMIKNNKIIISKDKKIQEYILNNDIQGLLNLEGKKEGEDYLECTKNDFEESFITGVEHDHKILEQLVKDWKQQVIDKNIDPKIVEFKKQLPNLLDKNNNPEQKIVIFTESADTMKYLGEKLQELPDYKNKFLSISGENRNQLKDEIRKDFDANLDKQQQQNKYQIIITTDVLAEGVNLHRANTIINYDTPWNATRLMQRIGRVNRIGSSAKNIFIHNFFPTKKIDDAIALAQNAKTKMQGFHSALGEDSQIYSTDEQTQTFAFFDKQVNEVNEVDERLIFLEEIKKFKKDNLEGYQRIEKLPHKLRNMVKNTKHKKATLSFIRTKDKHSSHFYFVKSNEIQEWTFIQSANLLKCDKKAKAQKCNLSKEHYQQVQLSVSTFVDGKNKTIIKTEQQQEISKKDVSAVIFLKAIAKYSNETDRININQGIELIKQGVFQQLTKEINKLRNKLIKQELTQQEAQYQTLELITKYVQEIPLVVKEKITNNNNPNIVISQSYV